jgi:hypothetical protein
MDVVEFAPRMRPTEGQPGCIVGGRFHQGAEACIAIDRLVHHSVVVEMNVESYRQRAATTRKNRPVAKAVPSAPERQPDGMT